MYRLKSQTEDGTEVVQWNSGSYDFCVGYGTCLKAWQFDLERLWIEHETLGGQFEHVYDFPLKLE